MTEGLTSVKCGHCGHEWITKSKRRYTTCPQCLYKVPVRRMDQNNGEPGKLDTKALENWLWDAACSIRGSVDAPKFKDYILPLVFVKRLSDVYDDEIARLAEQFGDEKTALELVGKDHGLVRFFIPEKANSESIRKLTTKVGERVTDALRDVAKANPKLQGVIDAVDFNATYAGQRVIDDTRLQALIEALSDPRYRLGLDDVEPDILGRAYEYLIRKFAEGQGGLLIKCELTVQEKYKEVKRPLQLFGQEINHVTYAMSRMNMIVHDMEGEIAIGDTLRNPKFLDGGALKKFDIVVANPMWMQSGYNGGFYENDPFGRFSAGYPTANSADWGWIQHMLASLSDHGKAGIVIDTGAVARGSGSEGSNKEREIRKAFVDKDLIEGVILLPENLFYNTTAAGVILILNKSKPKERKNQVILINASGEFEKGRPKNFIPDEKILKIANAVKNWRDIEGFSKIVSGDEIASSDYTLLPSRFVGPETEAEVKPLPEAVRALAAAEKHRVEVDAELNKVLIDLGFDGWKNG